jgi:hypothetical protein
MNSRAEMTKFTGNVNILFDLLIFVYSGEDDGHFLMAPYPAKGM